MESYGDKNIEYENCSPTHIHGRIWKLDNNADVTLDTYEKRYQWVQVGI